MALRLHVAAHHTETHAWFAVLGQKSRNDGVKRPLASSDHVGMLRVLREPHPPVLQADPGARHHNAAAKTHVVGLDQAHHHARLVGCGKVNRAALGRGAVLKVSCAVGVDQPGTFGQVGVRQQVGGGDTGHRTCIGHPAVGVGKGNFHGFNLQMLRLHAVDRVRGEIQPVQHAQRHQGSDALTIGGNLVQRVTSVVFLDRCYPLRPESGHVGCGHAASVGGCMAGKLFGEFTAIKRFPLGLGNFAQRCPSLGKHKTLAGFRRTTAWHKRSGKTWQVLQQRYLAGPFFGHDSPHRMAAFGQLDGGLEQIAKRQLAEALRQRYPSSHRTGRGDRIPAAQRHFGTVLALEIGRVPGRRGDSRRIQAMQFLAVPQDGKVVASQAVGDRLDDGHRCSSGNRSVHRIATFVQHAQTGLRREWLGGSHHIARHHRAANGGVGVVPVELHSGRTDEKGGFGRDQRCRGSRASRKPSPRRLKDSTSRKIDNPGQTAIQGALSI